MDFYSSIVAFLFIVANWNGGTMSVFIKQSSPPMIALRLPASSTILAFSYVPSCPVNLLSSTLPSPLPLLSNNLAPSFSPHPSPSSSPLTLHPNSPLTPLPPPSPLKIQSRLAVPQGGEGVDHASPRDRSQRQDPQLRERHLLLLRHGTVEEDTQGTAHWVRPLGGEASTPCHSGSAPLCRCGHAHSSNCVGVCGATPTSYIASYFEQLRCDSVVMHCAVVVLVVLHELTAALLCALRPRSLTVWGWAGLIWMHWSCWSTPELIRLGIRGRCIQSDTTSRWHEAVVCRFHRLLKGLNV